MKESADILGILPKLDPERNDAKHVLEFIFQKIVNFKKLNQDAPVAVGLTSGNNNGGGMASSFNLMSSSGKGSPIMQSGDGRGFDRMDYEDSKLSTP